MFLITRLTWQSTDIYNPQQYTSLHSRARIDAFYHTEAEARAFFEPFFADTIEQYKKWLLSDDAAGFVLLAQIVNSDTGEVVHSKNYAQFNKAKKKTIVNELPQAAKIASNKYGKFYVNSANSQVETPGVGGGATSAAQISVSFNTFAFDPNSWSDT